MKKNSFIPLLSLVAGCMGARVNTAPVPELPPADVWMRGTTAQAERLSNADEAEIVSNIVRDFYRPPRNQVRLISGMPLANDRSRWADSAVAYDLDRAGALARAVGLSNVCVDISVDPCAWKGPGGILRFSPAYGLTRDSARIYASYTPLRGEAGTSEIEFHMVRRLQGWQMASRRSLPPYAAQSDVARVVADWLFETDRRLGRANLNVVDALSAAFDDSVIVQVPGGFADGKTAAIAQLRATPANETSRITWTPIRAGVSADGQHGFTYGYMTMTRADGTTAPLKYLAYWINRGGQWKVLAYKRRGRPEGEVSLEVLPPALPKQAESVSQSETLTLTLTQSLAAAEKEFSDAAQTMGIGPAFERYGRLDAMNMGGPADTAFVVGNRNVGRSVGAGYPATGSPVHWAADYKTIVASSGDLGVTFGYIRPNTSPPEGGRGFPFFTIWKRDPGQPWRYIAE